MTHNLIRIATTVAALLGLALAAPSDNPAIDATVTVDHNTGSAANPSFKFKTVPSPAKDDAAAKAKLVLIAGDMDPNGADLSALTDGFLPTNADDPGKNFFFTEATGGGRFLMDLGNAIEIAQVNTYSWHPNTRGPQVYKLYASDGVSPEFNPTPKGMADLATVGWKLIATVDTRPKQGEGGGQYGVSITSPSGSLGKYRYLLFDCAVTEMDDDFGNTFYSEIDVVAKK
jgi:hypothetical protein